MRDYTIILQQTTQGWWIAFSPDFPGANTQGHIRAEALENMGEAIQLLRESYADEMINK